MSSPRQLFVASLRCLGRKCSLFSHQVTNTCIFTMCTETNTVLRALWCEVIPLWASCLSPFCQKDSSAKLTCLWRNKKKKKYMSIYELQQILLISLFKHGAVLKNKNKKKQNFQLMGFKYCLCAQCKGISYVIEPLLHPQAKQTCHFTKTVNVSVMPFYKLPATFCNWHFVNDWVILNWEAELSLPCQKMH